MDAVTSISSDPLEISLRFIYYFSNIINEVPNLTVIFLLSKIVSGFNSYEMNQAG